MTMVYETSCHRHVRIGRLDYASCFITALALNSKATVYVSGVRLHHVISYHIEQSHVTSQQLIFYAAVHISGICSNCDTLLGYPTDQRASPESLRVFTLPYSFQVSRCFVVLYKSGASL